MNNRVASPSSPSKVKTPDSDKNKTVPNGVSDVRDSSSDISNRSSLSRGSSKEGSPTKTVSDSQKSSISPLSETSESNGKEKSLNPFGNDEEDERTEEAVWVERKEAGSDTSASRLV